METPVMFLLMLVSISLAQEEQAISTITFTCSHSYGFLIEEKKVRSQLECSKMCLDNPICESFLYDPIMGLCSLNNETVDTNTLPPDCGQRYASIYRGQCDPGWIKHGSKCYKYFDLRYTWNASRDYCMDSENGDLANFKHPSLLAVFANVTQIGWLTATYDYWPWVGVHDMVVEGVFMNTDDQNLSPNVASMCTYNYPEYDCAYAWSGSIEMDGCGYTSTFICEKSSL